MRAALHKINKVNNSIDDATHVQGMSVIRSELRCEDFIMHFDLATFAKTGQQRFALSVLGSYQRAC